MFDNRKAMELQKLNGIENFRKLTIPQMLERGKLIELLREVQYLGCLEEKIANHLIANGVTIPVLCKDCSGWCRNVGLKDSPNGHCFTHDIDTNGFDFCSYGERKDK